MYKYMNNVFAKKINSKQFRRTHANKLNAQMKTNIKRKMANDVRLSEHDRNNDEVELIAGIALKSSLVP